MRVLEERRQSPECRRERAASIHLSVNKEKDSPHSGSGPTNLSPTKPSPLLLILPWIYIAQLTFSADFNKGTGMEAHSITHHCDL